MSNPSVKVLKKWSISSFEHHVEFEYKGKVHSNNFSLPGLKMVLNKMEDKKSDQYIIFSAMVNAVDKKSTKTVKTEEATNEHSKDNQV